MLGTPEQDRFVAESKWAVVTTLRRDGSPSNSVIFYARDGDELLFSTTRDRLKAVTVARDPRIAVTVIDEGAPYRYVTVEGRAAIQDQDIVEPHVAINRVMRGDANWQPPEGFTERLEREGRVIIRVAPKRVSGVVNRG